MSSPLAYLNGRFVPFEQASLPLDDAGFVSGTTIVDNSRTFRHKLFRWPDHLARFRHDCAECFIPLEASDEHITALAEELVEHNAKRLPPGGELHLVTFATPGPLGFYRGEAVNGPATFGMATYPLPFGRYRPFFVEGVTLAIAGFQASDSADIVPPGIKHRSRLVWHVAAKCLSDPGCHFQIDSPGAVPVVLSLDGVGDTAIGTILVVTRGKVIRAEHGTVLDSVSLRVVSELCGALGIPFDSAPLDMPWPGQSESPSAGRPERRTCLRGPPGRHGLLPRRGPTLCVRKKCTRLRLAGAGLPQATRGLEPARWAGHRTAIHPSLIGQTQTVRLSPIQQARSIALGLRVCHVGFSCIADLTLAVFEA